MCTNLSSQTLSYTMTLIVTYTQPYKGFFWVVNFFYSPSTHCPLYTLFISHTFGVLHSSQGVQGKCENDESFLFSYFEEFRCVMHSFFLKHFQKFSTIISYSRHG